MTGTTQASIFDENESATPGLWSFLSAAVLTRAAAVALALGSILTLVNQPEAIFGADQLQLLPLILVYATPFIVVTASQLLGSRRAILDARPDPRNDPAEEAFLTTAMRHGIPSRALLLGLLVGAVSTALAAAATLVDGGNPGAVASAPTVQAFILPVLFGVPSQAAAYRRAARPTAG